jgi:hypothetical protein
MSDGFIPKEACTVASGDCFYESRCLGGCRKVPAPIGWKCPVCGKGNAPFMPTCGNQLCGVDLSKGATA